MTAWTPKAQQVEVWTLETFPTRGFDPAGFDNSPRFDTGSPAGVWNARAKQAEVWTLKATP